MKSREKNVSHHSDYYLYNASEINKGLFFHPMSVGEFFYEPNYHLVRDRFDSFLVMLIQEGQCAIKTNGEPVIAHKGDVVLVDCYKPHAYGHDDAWSTLWLHFDGPLARAQFDQLFKTFGNVIRPRDVNSVEHTLLKILNVFRSKSNIKDASMSKYITNILTELFLSGTKKLEASSSSFDVEDIISFINENYVEKITLNDLADRANLSPYYFTKVFSKETGVTPHQYIILTRLNSAKFLLKTTDQSVKEIAFSSGFSSESVFCTSFKKNESITPTEYRLMNSI